MAGRKEYEEKTEKLLESIASANGVNIYDVEYVKEGSDYYLRAFIDKEGGVTIEDCEAVSRALSDELDKEDFIKDPYILEVSSPGLGRVLKKDRHLEYSIGEEVEIKLFEAIDGVKEFSGILKSFDKQSIVVETENNKEDNNKEIIFDRSKVSTVRLALDF